MDYRVASPRVLLALIEQRGYDAHMVLGGRRGAKLVAKPRPGALPLEPELRQAVERRMPEIGRARGDLVRIEFRSLQRGLEDACDWLWQRELRGETETLSYLRALYSFVTMDRSYRSLAAEIEACDVLARSRTLVGAAS